jgi:hypothetical protein
VMHVNETANLPSDADALRALVLSLISERDMLTAERDALLQRNEPGDTAADDRRSARQPRAGLSEILCEGSYGYPEERRDVWRSGPS